MKYILDISDDIGECKTAVVSGSEGMCFVNMTKLIAEERTGRWIPVSERLPDDVLCVTLVTDGIDVWSETWEGIRGKWKYNHSAITAWMPLPEPWKGEEDGRSN